jgi:hypothetical protein
VDRVTLVVASGGADVEEVEEVEEVVVGVLVA